MLVKKGGVEYRRGFWDMPRLPTGSWQSAGRETSRTNLREALGV